MCVSWCQSRGSPVNASRFLHHGLVQSTIHSTQHTHTHEDAFTPFDSTTSPDTGAYTSLAALTDSTEPKGSLFGAIM